MSEFPRRQKLKQKIGYEANSDVEKRNVKCDKMYVDVPQQPQGQLD
jgi:hypothetical protein